MSQREKVTLPDDVHRVTEITYGAKDEDWKYVRSDVIDTDLNKGWEEVTVILLRKADLKHFSFTFYRTNYHSLDDNNKWPLEGREVFPKQVMRTIYE